MGAPACNAPMASGVERDEGAANESSKPSSKE